MIFSFKHWPPHKYPLRSMSLQTTCLTVTYHFLSCLRTPSPQRHISFAFVQRNTIDGCVSETFNQSSRLEAASASATLHPWLQTAVTASHDRCLPFTNWRYKKCWCPCGSGDGFNYFDAAVRAKI
jgi:hypothetical protein